MVDVDEVEVVGFEGAQGFSQRFFGGVGGLDPHFGDEKEFVAAAGDELAEDFFGVPIDAGGVDVVDAAVHDFAEDFLGFVAVDAGLADGGGAEAENADFGAGAPEDAHGHGAGGVGGWGKPACRTGRQRPRRGWFWREKRGVCRRQKE